MERLGRTTARSGHWEFGVAILVPGVEVTMYEGI